MNYKKIAKTLVGLAKEGWTSYVLISLGLLAILLMKAYLSKTWVNSAAKNLTKDVVLEKQPIECKIVSDPIKVKFINEQRQDIIVDAFKTNHSRNYLAFRG